MSVSSMTMTHRNRTGEHLPAAGLVIDVVEPVLHELGDPVLLLVVVLSERGLKGHYEQYDSEDVE